jgi:beta-lactamase regulating signal transducer with metallopeptidase domain/HEAT repeat protein
VETQTLILLVVRATALLLAGAAVAALLRRSPAGARHLVWLATLAGLLALPLSLGLTPVRLPILPRALAPAPRAVVAPETAAAPRAPVPAEAAPASAQPPAPVAAPAPRALAVVLPPALLVVWVAVSSLLLAWLAVGTLAARRLVRGARPLDDARWNGLLCDVADRLGLAGLPRLLASERVVVPFAFGVVRPTIVLPATAEEWTDERRGQVLVHEIAHVRRRDLVAHALARLACALYWFHPLVWVAARRLRAESERACDDFVLACGARASDYAGFLLDVVAAARRPSAPALAVPMGRRRELEGRVIAILDPALKRGAAGRLQSGALLAGLFALFVAVAVTVPSAPALPDVQTADAQEPTMALMVAVEADEVQATAAKAAETTTAAEAAAEAASVEEASEVKAAQDASPARASAGSRAVLVRVLSSDPDASVRRSAAWALGQNSRGEDAAALAAALRGDADEGVREMAAWALGETEARGGEASAALAEALRKDQSEEVRAIAAWALGQNAQADPAPLLAAAGDGASEVRETAIWALGNRGLDKAPAVVTSALGDADASVRLVAAWALGEIHDPATASALHGAFKSEKDAEVKRAIFRALALLDEGSTQLIDEALASSDPELRQHAVMMAAGRGVGWPWPWPRPQPRPMP